MPVVAVFAALMPAFSGCGSKDPAKSDGPVATDARPLTDGGVGAKAPEAVNGKVLLVAQSVFGQDDAGKYVVPEAGELLVLSPVANGPWKVERIVEKESNVFHKALPYGKEGILTIGANAAILKLWHRSDGGWTAKTLWQTTFGGKQNRLRDFEQADFDGDGTNELAIATHDQGVIAVVWKKDDLWEAQEIDRKENTFVHEIEIGDLDGNGKKEIYTTPSEPNTASGVDQGGGVLRYEWTGSGFEKSEVVHYDKRHIKEVLVADVDGDGRQELYASVEAQMGEGFKIDVPVDIVRFDWKDGRYVPTPVMQMAGERFCRFLTAGDVDSDGAAELVAAAFSTGVWVIEKGADGYAGKVIDAKSGGFEHAAYLADIDNNGRLELYVADDNAGELKQHVFENGAFRTTVIHKRLVPRQAMVWNITTAEL